MTAMDRILTPQAVDDRAAFEAMYGADGNCSCHIAPPCGSCTHPGNPMNQEDDDSCWETSIDASLRLLKEAGIAVLSPTLVAIAASVDHVGEQAAKFGAALNSAFKRVPESLRIEGGPRNRAERRAMEAKYRRRR